MFSGFGPETWVPVAAEVLKWLSGPGDPHGVIHETERGPAWSADIPTPLARKLHVFFRVFDAYLARAVLSPEEAVLWARLGGKLDAALARRHDREVVYEERKRRAHVQMARLLREGDRDTTPVDPTFDPFAREREMRTDIVNLRLKLAEIERACERNGFTLESLLSERPGSEARRAG